MNPKMEKIVERTATSNMTPTMTSRIMAIVRPINDLQDGSRMVVRRQRKRRQAISLSM
jgi:hypothetical protein